MLGHKLVQRLTPRFETWATVRGSKPGPAANRILDPTRTVTGVRVEEPESVIHALEQSDATAVVNAIGIIKQLDAARAAIPSIRVNALFPHELATACTSRDARLIHISTDCVFSGDRGVYTEDSIPDARDLYGRSKLLGEVTDAPNAITLRTSIVGRELQRALGLFEWFLSQWWQGSRLLEGNLQRRYYHRPIRPDRRSDRTREASLGPVASERGADRQAQPAERLRDALEIDIEIDPDDSLVIDRSLDSSRFQSETGWTPPPWQAMLADLAADPTPYEELRHLDPVPVSASLSPAAPARSAGRSSDGSSGASSADPRQSSSSPATRPSNTQCGLDFQHRAVATDDVLYHEHGNLHFRIGDVCDFSSLAARLRSADVVFHAAALKQVPACEYQPFEAVKTNVLGAENLVRAIREQQLPVETVVGVTTDKACKPVNVMGMTKAMQERILSQANLDGDETRFLTARYGNVLASRGSVIPLFHEQIRRGGPVTVTTAEMTRFLLSLDDAVDTVFAALREGRRGETYVPRAPAVRVIDLAAALIGERDVRDRDLPACARARRHTRS